MIVGWVAAAALVGCAAQRSVPEQQGTSEAPPPLPEPTGSAPGWESPATDGGAAEPGPAAAADAGRDARALIEQLEAMNLRPLGARSGPSDSLLRAVSDFLRAVNGTDDKTANALSTAECWQKECGRFARQAGQKFQARAERYRDTQQRAVVRVQIVCPNDRLCDEVDLLLTLVPTGGTPSMAWRVADVVEDEAKANAWLDGKTP